MSVDQTSAACLVSGASRMGPGSWTGWTVEVDRREGRWNVLERASGKDIILPSISNNTSRAVAAAAHPSTPALGQAQPPQPHRAEQINTCFSLLAPDLVFRVAGWAGPRREGQVERGCGPCCEHRHLFLRMPWASSSFLLISPGRAGGKMGAGGVPLFSLEKKPQHKHICKCP